MRVITQDNLWHVEGDRHGYVWRTGKVMIPFEPHLGRTASADPEVKAQELQWLLRYTGRNGQGLVVALQWQRRGDLIDRNLNEVWLSNFQRHGQRAKFIIFYDPVLAVKHQGVSDLPVDYSNPAVMKMWRSDLDYLQPHFNHPKYFRIGGKPVLYSWATHGSANAGRAFAEARSRGLYMLCDVFGGRVNPAHMSGVTGFTSALPGRPRGRRRILEVLPDLQKEFDYWRGKGDLFPASSLQYDDTEFQLAQEGEGSPPVLHLAHSKDDVLEVLRVLQREADFGYVMLGTANNWAEGTTCLPTAKESLEFSGEKIGHYGFRHLEAIQEVLFPNLMPYTGPRFEVRKRKKDFLVYRVQDLDVLGKLQVRPKKSLIYDKEKAGYVRRIKVLKGARILARNLDGKKTVIEEVGA